MLCIEPEFPTNLSGLMRRVKFITLNILIQRYLDTTIQSKNNPFAR